MYDLHLHSTYSDGDQSVTELVAAAAEAGVHGISVTDHNGLWGDAEASAAAAQHDLEYISGIEISARAHGADLHILGYSHGWQVQVLVAGLQNTRSGYERRAKRMIELCTEAGYELTINDLTHARSHQQQPVYMAYDVGRMLTHKHGLTVAEARKLTSHGGLCHVPYGEWALSPQAAVDLIHDAGGIAVFAHPGTVSYEEGDETLNTILAELVAATVDGLEVYHPFHDSVTTAHLQQYAQQHKLVVTGGSDWHGPGRYHEGALGTIGLPDEDWLQVRQRLQERFPQAESAH